MQTPRLLLVEDDPNLGDILREYLALKGFQATLCSDGQAGFSAFLKGSFDMCILDVMMPIMDGFTLAEKIRANNKNIPIIFLTAKGMKEDKFEGFRVGADDYITKPFSMEELLLRINAVLRRSLPPDDGAENYKIGDYQFSTLQQTLQYENDPSLKLTTKETALLKLLCQSKNHVLEREYALKSIWGEDNYFTARSMDVFITKLRKYLGKDERIQIINIHSKGYKLIEGN
jgi:DNA-binding response OmpR family regulator